MILLELQPSIILKQGSYTHIYFSFQISKIPYNAQNVSKNVYNVFRKYA